MSSRPLAAGLLLALALSTLPGSAEAQLGGLVKKARARVAPAAGQQQSTDEAARLPGPTLTQDMIDRLLTGFATEKRARDRAEQEEARRRQQADAAAQARRSQQDQYESYQQCTEAKAKADPGYGEAERLTQDAQAAAQRGETAKAMQMAQRIQQLMGEVAERARTSCASLEPSATPAATPEESAIQSTADSSEVLGARAAGLTAVEYGQAKELLFTYLNYPQKAGLTANERGAVDPKRRELKEALKGVGLQ